PATLVGCAVQGMPSVKLSACTPLSPSFFFFADPAPTEIYTLSLHDALPISSGRETSTSAALVAPEAVANTRAVPLDLPATLPFASIVATDVGLIDQVTAPGGWWTPFTSRR